ncbi:cell surface glycoprotein [Tieghemostelium lacteum]|uniref:Cell surface glycoprotein n=1 Tax=Tieghemostelium lacteum TaxID=361077 RepID=A0A151ZHJ7_TIELA|nr:cell surface glycoprotein [Tieghemostelium lacteum]|eukprot:KYQ93433.1 cell surface glycoprotein [Tieghemostelium lacteum]
MNISVQVLNENKCASTSTFFVACIPLSGVLHVASINLNIQTANPTIEPGAPFQLNFPELTFLSINSPNYNQSNPSYNILSMLNNVLKLETLILFGENSVTKAYPLPPTITTLAFTFCKQLMDITDMLQPTLSAKLTVVLAPLDYSIFGNPSTKINVTSLNIKEKNPSSSSSIIFRESNYPSLTDLTVQFVTNKTLDVRSTKVTSITMIQATGIPATINITKCPNLNYLDLGGDINLVPSNLSTYSNLDYIRTSSPASGPLINIIDLPNSVNHIEQLLNPYITNIPNFYKTNNLNKLILASCANLNDEVDFYFNHNNPDKTYQLTLSATKINGILPEDYCIATLQSQFNFMNTPNFGGFPDCFKCYSSLYTTQMLNPKYNYTGFTCVPKVTSITSIGLLPTIITVTGKNLGYGAIFASDPRITMIDNNGLMTFNTTDITSYLIENVTLASNNVKTNINWVSLKSLSNISIKQFPIGKAKVTFTDLIYNPSESLSISLNNVLSTNISSNGEMEFEIDLFLDNGNYSLKIMNGVASNIINEIPFELEYPSITSIHSNGSTSITIIGNFGKLEQTSVEINGTQCEIKSKKSNEIICQTSTEIFYDTPTQIYISVDGYENESTQTLQLITLPPTPTPTPTPTTTPTPTPSSSPSSSSKPSNESKDKKSNLGAILGPILGAAFLAFLIASILIYRKRSKRVKNNQPKSGNGARKVFMGGKVQELDQF